MPDLWTDLLACLDLRQLDEIGGDGGDTDLRVFAGANQNLEYHRVFGGQILGQCIEAARRASPDKTVKSLHCVFPREGRADEPTTYRVQVHHEGRTFATLSITASQPSGLIASATASMHVVEDGREHQTTAEVPAPLGPEYEVPLTLIPWETRSAHSLDEDAATPPEYALWMRTPEVDSERAAALTAYATDLTLIGTALRPIEGVNQRGNGTTFASAVTSHTIWFHRPFRTDQWLLLRQHSPLVAHGRTFGRGDVLTASGTLVASYAQESMVRFRP